MLFEPLTTRYQRLAARTYGRVVLKDRATVRAKSVGPEDGVQNPTVGTAYELLFDASTAEPPHPSDSAYELDRIGGSDLSTHHLHRKREVAPSAALHESKSGS